MSDKADNAEWPYMQLWAERLAHYWPDAIKCQTLEEFRERFADRIKFYRSELDAFASAHSASLHSENERLEQEVSRLRADLKTCAQLLWWLDALGGLGLDVHEQIRAALSLPSVVEALKEK